MWTVLFVVVNQIAYAVVVRLASSGTAQAGVEGGAAEATGYTVYAQTFLIVMVPHAIVTVSLATAMLPLLSAYGNAGDLRALARSLSRVLRTALAVIVPFAALLPVVAPDLAAILWNWGAASSTYDPLHPLAVAVRRRARLLHRALPDAARLLRPRAHPHRLLHPVRGRRDQHRSWRSSWSRATDAVHTSPALVGAYIASYVVGSAVSYLVLRRMLAAGGGGLDGAVLVRFVVRLALAAGVATFAAGARDPAARSATTRATCWRCCAWSWWPAPTSWSSWSWRG